MSKSLLMFACFFRRVPDGTKTGFLKITVFVASGSGFSLQVLTQKHNFL